MNKTTMMNTILPAGPAVAVTPIILLLAISVGAKERVKVITSGEQPGHYLIWNGQPILPIGDSTTQGWMESGLNFDQEDYLNALSSRGINVAMIWSYIATDNLKQIGDARIGYDAPEILPWLGSTQGDVANLQEFNQAYFDRLAIFVSYAESKDLLVLITVHDGWTKTLFNRHPFNASQGNGPLSDRSQYVELADYNNEMPTVFNPAWNRQQQNQYFQERFADKLITELEPYSNVMYEIFNEGEWYDHSDRRHHEEHFLEFFRARTDALLLTNSDHIFGDDPHNNPNVDIVSFHGSAWTGEHNQFVDGFNSSPPKPYFMSEQIPDFNGQNVSLNDIRQGAWEQAMAGAGWVAQNDTSFSWDANAAITSQIAVRNQVYDQVGHVATFFNDLGVEFWDMAPDPELASTGVALANPGAEYLVYADTGGAFTIDLSAAAGKTLSVQWYDPRTGVMSAAPSIAGGSQETPFTTPDDSDWVLWLDVEPVPEPASFYLLTGVGGCFLVAYGRWLPRGRYVVVLMTISWILFSPSLTVAENKSTRLATENGWYVHNGKAVWGLAQHNGWWRAGQRPNITRNAPGQVGPNRTEDLDKLTSAMLRFGYPGFEHNFGLWYDRRRDMHDRVHRQDNKAVSPFLEQPWARSGEGSAWDGLSRYDLTRFNDWYFQRLKKFADLCDRKGTILIHNHYMQHALLETNAHYVDFPWRPTNCIQQTELPDENPAANAFYNVSHPLRRQLHRAYIRKCLDVLGANTNVVFLCSEEYTGPREFIEFWLDTIVDWEAETGHDVHVGLSATKDVMDAILSDRARAKKISTIDLRNWWYEPDGGLRAPSGGRQIASRYTYNIRHTTPEQIHRQVAEYRRKYPEKVIIHGYPGTRQHAWAALMGGASLLVGQLPYPDKKDPMEYTSPEPCGKIQPTYDFIREQLSARLPQLSPCDELVKSDIPAWCLADPNATYLIYALEGGPIQLDLSIADGSFDARWFNPRTGKLHDAHDGPVTGGAIVRFTAPDQEDWGLWLHKSGEVVTSANLTTTGADARLAPHGGALAGQKPRVIVSTDVGGSDPDDFQSMVHLLVYADVLDIEGLISSPPQAGRAGHILGVIDAYENDYSDIERHSDRFPTPEALRRVTKQGAIAPMPPEGWREPTAGSRWIIRRAKVESTRPLWVLVWGSITDVAQAVHDDPSIKESLRVYSIGSWNTRMDQAARDYLYEHHPDLWWIESNTTFRGMYIGGQQDGPWGNRGFVDKHVRGHGALGNLFFGKKQDIKMGDTPSLLYLLRGDPNDPTAPHWGGAYVKTAHGENYWTDDPNNALAEDNRAGAKTVNRWRVDFLTDWQQRMDWASIR